jgi:hypothetical protein
MLNLNVTNDNLIVAPVNFWVENLQFERQNCKFKNFILNNEKVSLNIEMKVG